MKNGRAGRWVRDRQYRAARAELANHKEFSCTRKVVYSSLEAAANACSEMREKPNYQPRPGGLLPYQCLYDSAHWHIGSGGSKARAKATRVRLALLATATAPDAGAGAK